MLQAKKIKFPYGRSNFAGIIKEGYYFVDKTPYLEWLDEAGESYLIFLRPRRFGKSLFLSMMEYYYGAEHEKDFETLFGNYYIGQHSTAVRNKFWILKFNFSGISTNTAEDTKKGFISNVKYGIEGFINKYLPLTVAQKQTILQQTEAHIMLREFLRAANDNASLAIYLLIDEYDHFANELLAFDFASFKALVSRNGFIRKFYETIKIVTEENIINRLFITGVTPITLDSLTSSFNIGANFSKELALNEMMGFTTDQVQGMLQAVSETKDVAPIMEDLKKWYNGYVFNVGADQRIYNSDMVLYFLKYFQRYQRYPSNMLDTNISSDYSKLRRLFSLQTPIENYKILSTIIKKNAITGKIIEEFSFERVFEENDFISLLYYLGYLTLKDSVSGIAQLQIPNYVIEKLYLDYFLSLIKEQEALPSEMYLVELALIEMADKGNPLPFLQIVQNVLSHLSRRDYQRFDEKYIRVIMIALALQVKTYFVSSERETKEGYIDILFTKHQPFNIKHQYIFELKYLKKEDAAQLEISSKKAAEQILTYVQQDQSINTIEGLQAWTIVVVKDEIKAKRVL